MWQHFIELKFILSLFLTPAVYPLTMMFSGEGQTHIEEATKNKIQFYIVCFFMVYSPFTKYFREDVCLNFERDIIMDKVTELQKKFDESAANKDKPLTHKDSEDEDEVVSDDGTAAPGKKVKKEKKDKKKNPTKEELKEQIEKM